MSDRQLLIARIDHTLTGDSWALRRFADWYEMNSDRVTLAYCSWRQLDTVEEFIEQDLLPAPDAVIGGGGTELHHYASGEAVCGWGRHASHWNVRQVREHLALFESLTIDSNVPRTPLRVRCVARNLTARELHGIRRHLQDVDLQVTLVYDDCKTLDVLPEGLGIGPAAAFLARCWEFDDDDVLVSAISAKDIGLFGRRFRGIVPANAHPVLRRLSLPRVHQSILACAAGVLEGIRRFGADDAARVPGQAVGAL